MLLRRLYRDVISYHNSLRKLAKLGLEESGPLEFWGSCQLN
jgi:hypothetical protein